MKVGQIIKNRRLELGLSVDDVAKKIGKNRATIYRYESSDIENLPVTVLEPLAKVLNTTPAELMGWVNPNNNGSDIFTDDVVTFPVIGEVAAGFDYYAYEDIEPCEQAEFPKKYLSGRTASDFFVLKIRGMSMYPMYIPGDIILVKKTPTVDSGQIAIIQYDDYATIKKIEKTKQSVRLIPINPTFPPEEKEGADLDNFHILGIPVCLLRDIQ